MKEKLLKDILNKSPDQLSEKDIDVLLQLFHKKFGFSSGIALNPQFLVDDFEIEGITTIIPEGEDLVVQEWLSQDEVRHFDPTQTKQLPEDLDFMCSNPEECSSFKQYAFACSCIRDNFSSPNDFCKWRDKQLTELGNQLQAIIPDEN